jgi:hypothetical protein
MTFNSTKKVLTRTLLAVLLLFGVWSTGASAQVRVVQRPRVVVVNRPFFPRFYPRYYSPRYYTVVDPIAYQKELGYSDGLSRGKDDAKHGKPNDPSTHKHYTNSESITYREAFAQGYADGYNQRMG